MKERDSYSFLIGLGIQQDHNEIRYKGVGGIEGLVSVMRGLELANLP